MLTATWWARPRAASATAAPNCYTPWCICMCGTRAELYLQHRPAWKDIQPDKWDTAVGGHVDLGEDIATALRREVKEELGLTDFEPEFLTQYLFESERERELVHVFRTVTDVPPAPTSELDGGRFFTVAEIEARLGTDFFTPNFEGEWRRLQALA